MKPLSFLPRRLRRYLLERLELLHEALSSLARRLRESIASVIGSHVGEAVRDALRTALEQQASDTLPDEPQDDYRPRYPYQDWHDPYQEYAAPSSPYFDEPAPLWHDERPATSSVPPNPPANRLSRWWSFLPAALRALTVWLRGKEARPAGLTLLGIGALAAGVTLVVHPLAGALFAVAGTVCTLTTLMDSAREVVHRLAGGCTP